MSNSFDPPQTEAEAEPTRPQGRPYFAYLLHPTVRLVLAWLIALGTTGEEVMRGWDSYKDTSREYGTEGHTTIDFGGQWLMGRLLVTGNGRHLYNRIVQRRLLEEAYPRIGDEETYRDANNLMSWVMGEDDPQSFLTPLAAHDPLSAAAYFAAGQEPWSQRNLDPYMGGPLYPPLNAFVFAPLGMLPPGLAYRVMFFVNLTLTFVCSFLVARVTRGWVWWPVALTLVFFWPGYSGAFHLGQNPLITLTIALTGWRLVQTGRPIAGGVVWGFLAYKPVWAAAFFLTPLLTKRWRMAASMAATGVVLVALTLPVVGVQAWLDWRRVGVDAADTYAICGPWIALSRDLMGLPRRYLLTFPKGHCKGYAAVDDEWGLVSTRLGLALLLSTIAVTVIVALRRRRDRPVDGSPGDPFVLLGSWLSCYHFMYYDTVIAVLPVALLYTEWTRYVRFRLQNLEGGNSVDAPDAVDGYDPPPAFACQIRVGRRWWCATDVLRPFVPVATILFFSLSAYTNLYDHENYWPPCDTLMLLALWMWCGCRWWFSAEVGRQVRRPDAAEGVLIPASAGQPA